VTDGKILKLKNGQKSQGSQKIFVNASPLVAFRVSFVFRDSFVFHVNVSQDFVFQDSAFRVIAFRVNVFQDNASRAIAFHVNKRDKRPVPRVPVSYGSLR